MNVRVVENPQSSFGLGKRNFERVRDLLVVKGEEMSDATGYEQIQSEILRKIDQFVVEAESNQKPLELDPFRGELFKMFVDAYRAGLTADESPVDLSADGLCKSLSEQWGLKTAAQSATANQTQLGKPHLDRMRSLWSIMRLWMEWTYAWDRWSEFHTQ